MDVIAESGGVEIDGNVVSRCMTIDEWQRLVGPADLVDEFHAAPAPWGHRNNQRHVYDSAGFYLNEHHKTGLIHEVVFVLRPELALVSTSRAFEGRLSVLGVSMSGETTETKLPPVFDKFLPGHWYAEVGAVRVDLDLRGDRLASGRRSKVRRLSTVHVGFEKT